MVLRSLLRTILNFITVAQRRQFHYKGLRVHNARRMPQSPDAYGLNCSKRV